MSLFTVIKEELIRFRNYGISISIEKAILYITLSLIIILNVILRILPSKFGLYISEFDPYFQLYATKVIIDAIKDYGVNGLFSFFTHHIDLTWHPHGVDMGLKYYPGVPYTGAFVYFLANLLGIGVTAEQVALWLPVIMSVFTIIGVFIIGREFGGNTVGLLSSTLSAIAPAFIGRSNIGWYDTECVGIPAFIFSILFYIKSLKADDNNLKIIYAILSGLCAGYMGASWGAFSYLATLYGVFPLILLLIRSLPKQFSRTHITTVVIMLIIINSVPRNKLSYVTGILALILYLSILISILHDNIKVEKIDTSSLFIFSMIFLSLLITISLSVFPVGLTSRHLSVVNPFYRAEKVFVQTVQEQAMVNVGAFLYHYNILIPFLIFGIYILLLKRDSLSLLLVILALSLIYSSSNFARLFALSTLIVAIVSSIGIKETMNKLYTPIFKRIKHRKYEVGSQITTLSLSLSIILILFLLYSGYFVGVRHAASIPPTIAAASTQIPDNIDDWLEALSWIKDNIPEDAVIAAWWDYGYWISYIAERKSLADNGTLNISRIELLAEIFLSNESKALEILRSLGADYVLIFIGTSKISAGGQTYYTLTGVGEDSKFLMMAKIIGLPSNLFVYSPEERREERKPMYKDRFWDTFLGKLIPYKYITTQEYGGRLYDLYIYSPKYPEGDFSSSLTLVFRSSNEKVGEILIYKINW